MRRFFVSFLMVVVIFDAGQAFAQNYPSKPVRILSAEAGGAGDAAMRIITPVLSAALGQPIVIENRGGGLVAPEIVAKATPDGYTLLDYGNSFWLMPLMRSHVPYDPVKDFAPIIMRTVSYNILVVHPRLGVNSVKELIALIKARPGKLNYSSASIGTTNHLAAEMFKSMTGTDMVRVPFKGSAPALNALLGGETDVMFSSPAPALPHVQSGRIKALAVTSLVPSAISPGLPLIATTLPGFEVSSTHSMFAPKGTPAPVIKRLNQEMVKLLKTPEMKDRLFKIGLEIVASTPEELAAAIQKELGAMGKVIKSANIRDE